MSSFLSSLESLARKAEKLGREADAGAIRNHRTYFQERRRMLNYKQCLAEGLLIGSGMIEGGIRFVGKDRLHGTGMRWSAPGAVLLDDAGLAGSGRRA